MITVEALKKYGANVEEGLARCMNNEVLYLKLVGMAADEENFDRLHAALEQKNLKDAFEAAHALKGVIANLAITPLHEKIAEITELLRAETDMDYTALEEEINSKREELRKLM